MRVDNSTLTGESIPLFRDIQCTSTNPLETKNLAFFGTMIKEGSGKGIVINIGDYTVKTLVSDISTTEKSPKPSLNS